MNKTQILLTVSLLINAFFVGYLFGNGFELNRTSKKRHMHHRPEHFPISKEQRALVREKREQLFEIMTAKEFDEATFDTKIKELELIHDEIRSKMPEKLKAKMRGKTQEQRMRIAKRIKHKHHRRFKSL
jgi:Spy/CpxP family protein refolding chaperone